MRVQQHQAPGTTVTSDAKRIAISAASNEQLGKSTPHASHDSPADANTGES